MRTYDKLIATIHTRQSAGDLRTRFGSFVAGCGGSVERLVSPDPQDDSTHHPTP